MREQADREESAEARRRGAGAEAGVQADQGQDPVSGEVGQSVALILPVAFFSPKPQPLGTGPLLRPAIQSFTAVNVPISIIV